MMRRCLAVIVAATAVACAVPARGAEATGQQLAEGAGRPLVGAAAPPLVLTTIDGETIDLARLYGRKAVYLKFWATWCVPCREQMPHFEKSYESAGADLAVIAVNAGFTDSIEDVRAYRRELGLRMPIVFDDGRIGAAFRLRVTPQHVVIGRDGRVLYVGHLADARLERALAEARVVPAAGAAARRASVDAAATPHYAVGDRLPARSVRTVDGRAVSLLDPADARRTVLVFLSPWCESYLATSRPLAAAQCRRMREQVEAASKSHDARWLGIASKLWATREDVREYAGKYGVAIPLALDESGGLFRAFDVTQVPVALVAERDGRIVRRIEARELTAATSLGDAIAAQ